MAVVTDVMDLHLARTKVVTSRNFRRLGYERLTRGVYGHQPSTAELDEWDARRTRFFTSVRAILAAYSGKPVVLYGPTALQILGVALPPGVEDWENCHLLVRQQTCRPERKGVVLHQTTAQWSVWRRSGPYPLLHPVDHWVQLRGASIDDLIAAGDGLMRRRQPLLSLDQLTGRLAQLAGTPGVKQARLAVPWLVAGTDSIQETRTRLLLVHAGLGVPTVNCPIYCPAAGRTYHADMAYEAEKLAIEFDGAVHVGDRRQMEIDAIRRLDLQNEGWLIITVTAAQLRHPRDVIRSVETALILRRAESRCAW